jgi:hypothetical protein
VPEGELEPITERGPAASSTVASDAEPTAAERRRLRKLWARLVHWACEVDPLLWNKCGGSMRIPAFVLEPGAIRKILAHLAAKGGRSSRAAPPVQPSSSTFAQ